MGAQEGPLSTVLLSTAFRLGLITSLFVPMAQPWAHARVSETVGFDVEKMVIVWAADETGVAPIISDFVVDTDAGSGDADLLSGDVHTVVTGTLAPAFDVSGTSDVQSRLITVERSPSGGGQIDSNGNGQTDGGDTFSPFTLDDRTNLGLADSDTPSSFFVASNAPFNIDAEAIRVVGRGDWVLGKIFWDMSVTPTGADDGVGFGTSAQLPHTAGPDGGIAAVANLLDLKTRQTVFSGDRRTAISAGSIAEQSVRFDVTYTLGSWSGYHLAVQPTNLAEGIYEVEAEVTYTVWIP